MTLFMKSFIATLALSITASTAFAATQISSFENKQKIGVVSVSSSSSVDDVVSKLSDAADKEGASSFKIISVGGSNKMYGVAEIYK